MLRDFKTKKSVISALITEEINNKLIDISIVPIHSSQCKVTYKPKNDTEIIEGYILTYVDREHKKIVNVMKATNKVFGLRMEGKLVRTKLFECDSNQIFDVLENWLLFFGEPNLE